MTHNTVKTRPTLLCLWPQKAVFWKQKFLKANIPGSKISRNFCSRKRKFHMWTFALGNESSSSTEAIKLYNRSPDPDHTPREDFSSVGWDLLWSTCVPNLKSLGAPVTKLWITMQNAENGVVRGHSRSSAMSPFDRAHTTSYLTLIETMYLSCTVFEI